MNALLLRLLTVTLLWLSACCISQAISRRFGQEPHKAKQLKTAQPRVTDRPAMVALTLPLPADSSQLTICLRWP